MAQDENSKQPAYIEYDPKAEAVCGICMRVVPLFSHHVCIKLRQTAEGHVLDSENPTLRDQFAMAGLAASMNHGGSDPAKWAEHAYRIADAMMAARKNPPK